MNIYNTMKNVIKLCKIQSKYWGYNYHYSYIYCVIEADKDSESSEITAETLKSCRKQAPATLPPCAADAFMLFQVIIIVSITQTAIHLYKGNEQQNY